MMLSLKQCRELGEVEFLPNMCISPSLTVMLEAANMSCAVRPCSPISVVISSGCIHPLSLPIYIRVNIATPKPSFKRTCSPSTDPAQQTLRVPWEILAQLQQPSPVPECPVSGSTVWTGRISRLLAGIELAMM